MERRKFVQLCGFACVSSSISMLLLNSCTSAKTVIGKVVDTDIVIPLDSFLAGNRKKEFRKYILVEHPQLKYPICVFRFSHNEYSALLMQCTHQGAELQVFGDRLECPAHGSEFDNKGTVQNGPADIHLRSFPTLIVNNEIKISIKNV